MQPKQLKLHWPKQQFLFVWSPEGRPVTAVFAENQEQATRLFKRENPMYAGYMGEVSCTPVPAVRFDRFSGFEQYVQTETPGACCAWVGQAESPLWRRYVYDPAHGGMWAAEDYNNLYPSETAIRRPA